MIRLVRPGENKGNHVLMLLTMTTLTTSVTVQGTLYYDEQYDHCFAPRNSTPKDRRVEAVSAI